MLSYDTTTRKATKQNTRNNKKKKQKVTVLHPEEKESGSPAEQPALTAVCIRTCKTSRGSGHAAPSVVLDKPYVCLHWCCQVWLNAFPEGGRSGASGESATRKNTGQICTHCLSNKSLPILRQLFLVHWKFTAPYI